MKRALLLAVILLFLIAPCASAVGTGECITLTEIWYQLTEYQDGTKVITILSIEQFQWCDVVAPPPPPPGPDLPPQTIPPSVSLAFADTTDPSSPMVGIDVNSNDARDPVAWVVLEVNGTTEDYSGFYDNARYQLHLRSIGQFGENGSVTLNAKACTGSGVCGESSAFLERSTTPKDNDNTIAASWQEEEEKGPVTRQASYGHGLRQMYTYTHFGCSEIGENSRYEIRESVVTISGQDPMPLWSDSIYTSGTINNASYTLSESANPVGCTYPTLCSSKSGSSAGSFGYSISVRDDIGSFVVEGMGTIFTNGSLEVSFP